MCEENKGMEEKKRRKGVHTIVTLCEKAQVKQAFNEKGGGGQKNFLFD